MRSLSAQDAAAALKISTSTLRKRAIAGRIKRDGRDQYLIADAASEDVPDELADAMRALRGQHIKDARDPIAKVKSSRIDPIVVIGDVHIPDHDPLLWANFLQWCRDEQPSEVVLCGDFLELESCSSHGGVARPSMLVDEIRAGREALDQLRAANPNAKITYLEGNHETRLSRKVIDRMPELDGSMTVPELLDLRGRGIEWFEYGEAIMRGKLALTHGWYTPMHHAKKHLEELGCSVMYGHTHRPQVYTRGKSDGSTHGAFGLPCMRTLDAGWLHRRPSGWMQGFGVVYVHEDGCFSPFVVLVNNGTFVWSGRVYGKGARA